MDVTQTCHRSKAAEYNRLSIRSAAGIVVTKMERVSVTRSLAEDCNVLFRE
jgi:hypothetical protein